MLRTCVTSFLFLLCSGLLAASPALAQQMSEIRFERGTSGATLSGSITGFEYMDYRLGASEGQLMVASIEVNGTNGNGTIYFNILPPGSDDVAIWIGDMRAERVAEIVLPASGTYTLRAYLMGNDRDTEKTVGYLLHVGIN